MPKTNTVVLNKLNNNQATLTKKYTTDLGSVTLRHQVTFNFPGPVKKSEVKEDKLLVHFDGNTKPSKRYYDSGLPKYLTVHNLKKFKGSIQIDNLKETLFWLGMKISTDANTLSFTLADMQPIKQEKDKKIIGLLGLDGVVVVYDNGKGDQEFEYLNASDLRSYQANCVQQLVRDYETAEANFLALIKEIPADQCTATGHNVREVLYTLYDDLKAQLPWYAFLDTPKQKEQIIFDQKKTALEVFKVFNEILIDPKKAQANIPGMPDQYKELRKGILMLAAAVMSLGVALGLLLAVLLTPLAAATTPLVLSCGFSTLGFISAWFLSCYGVDATIQGVRNYKYCKNITLFREYAAQPQQPAQGLGVNDADLQI